MAICAKPIEMSFNRISVDGDTSTNDTVLLMASGASGATIGAAMRNLPSALTRVCTSLAKQIVADGEGVRHVVELRIERRGQRCRCAEGREGHCTFAAGEDCVGGQRSELGPADGGDRLLGCGDRSGAHRHLVWEQRICREGGRAAELDEAAAHAYLKQREFSIIIELNQGAGTCVFWTTDLTPNTCTSTRIIRRKTAAS